MSAELNTSTVMSGLPLSVVDVEQATPNTAVMLDAADAEFLGEDTGTLMTKREQLPAGMRWVPASRLCLWEDNPRLSMHGIDMGDKAREAKAKQDKDLTEDFSARIEGGLNAWRVEYPAIVLIEKDEKYDPKGSKVYPVKQGNCRLSIIHAKFPNEEVPCRFEVRSPESIISAISDGNVGLLEKSEFDAQLALIKFFRVTKCSRGEAAKYLYFNDRRLLSLVSPTTSKMESVADAVKNSTGALQKLYQLSRLPDELVALYFTECVNGARAKSIQIDIVSKLHNVALEHAKDPEDVRNAAIMGAFEDIKAERAAKKEEANAAKRDPAFTLTHKVFMELQEQVIAKCPKMKDLYNLYTFIDGRDAKSSLLALAEAWA